MYIIGFAFLSGPAFLKNLVSPQLDVGDYMPVHTCISLYVVSVVMYVSIALCLIMNHTKILSGSSANFSVNIFSRNFINM